MIFGFLAGDLTGFFGAGIFDLDFEVFCFGFDFDFDLVKTFLNQKPTVLLPM